VEISRSVRRKIYQRNQLIRIAKLLLKTATVGLLIISWHIDRHFLFPLVAMNVTLGLLLVNFYNIRKFIPGINSSSPLYRCYAITLYVLAVLGVLSCISQG
jgi:hypothetical protein